MNAFANEPFGPLSGGASAVPSADDTLQPLPVPDGSEPPGSHPGLGKYITRWSYADANGGLQGYVCRFETPAGKETRPLRYGILKDRKGWHWKGWGDCRPLYRLAELLAREDAPVLLVEGEKTADAAAALLPEYAVVTTMNGAQSPGRSDFSPLAGRAVSIWPDNDEAGRDYARKAGKLALDAGATLVRMVNVPDGAPEKWDLADPLPATWTEDAIETALSDAEPLHVDGAPAVETDWQPPEPLLAEHVAPLPYPVDALPPVMRDAVLAYQSYGQQPLALVASAALASTALACQGLADVDRDGNLVGPCSLSFLIIAESGERKTAVDKRFARAARAWQKERREEAEPAIRAARSRLDAWLARREGILARIKKLSGSVKPEDENDCRGLEGELKKLDHERPRVPPLPAIFLEDVTPEALAVCLAEGWPTASLWSDEGGLVVGSHAMSDDSVMRFLALLNRLWDGNPFDRRRTTRESVTIEGRRFSASLMMQPLVVAKFLAAADGAARGTGALARCLICWPESTMGSRSYVPGDLDAPQLRAFDARMRELLALALPIADPERMILDPPKLRLNDAAFRIWTQLHDEIEGELAARGEFSELRDFAAKGAEQAARIACVLHVFEHGPDGEISAASMEAGAAIVHWHLHEARRMLGMAGHSGAYADAAALLEWVREQPAPQSPRDMLRLGPYRIRDKSRRDRALAMLYERSLAREETRGKGVVIVLNPALGTGL